MHNRIFHSDKIAVLTAAILLIIFLAIPAYGKKAALTQLSDTTFQEISTQKVWHLSRSKRFKTGADVTEYLKTLNEGEFNDWRLPTQKELFQLFLIFDLKQNGTVKTRLEGSYWLSDINSIMYTGAWEIGDQCGPSRAFYTSKAGYVRAIRP